MLARIRKSKADRDQGFTLIELLVVMIIIGILAAIAIPVFLNQKKKAVDASLKSDLKSAAQAEETNFVDNNAYLGTAALNAAIQKSPGNTIDVQTTATGYCIRASNTNSSTTATTWFWYDSAGGGLKAGAPTAAFAGASCVAGFAATA
jgi:type II secretion system protein G